MTKWRKFTFRAAKHQWLSPDWSLRGVKKFRLNYSWHSIKILWYNRAFYLIYLIKTTRVDQRDIWYIQKLKVVQFCEDSRGDNTDSIVSKGPENKINLQRQRPINYVFLINSHQPCSYDITELYAPLQESITTYNISRKRTKYISKANQSTSVKLVFPVFG